MSNPSFMPTILLPEIYFPFANEPGFLARKIEEFAVEGFYKGIEIATIEDSGDRKRIKEATSSAELTVVQWMTALITNEKLDLSSINSLERLFAVETIKQNIKLATECGATHIALIAGPDPGVELREKASESLYKSLCEVSSIAKDFGMDVIIEPLDRHAHKKRFLGPTDESIEILSRVKESHENIGLAFDTAHAALNNEDIHRSLELSHSFISQIHLSNAVLDQSKDLFGDYHMPLGDPGFLNMNAAIGILNKSIDLGIPKNLRVSVEVKTLDHEDPEATEREAKSFLKKLIEQI